MKNSKRRRESGNNDLTEGGGCEARPCGMDKYTKNMLFIGPISDGMLAMARAEDRPISPDTENHWHCAECGYGVGIPPGGIIKETGYVVLTGGKCPKCNGQKFSKSMLANKI